MYSTRFEGKSTYPSCPASPLARFILRACLHEVQIFSSNRVQLSVPVPSASQPGFPGPPSATSTGLVHENTSSNEKGSGVASRLGDADETGREGSNVSNHEEPEGRVRWRGEELTPLRMPLFLVEITTVGEKGKERFAFTQRLGAVKDTTLTLMDKAIASTQVTARDLW